jgi:nucleoside-triphosphatase THEP1
MNSPVIWVVTGLRHSGKTTFCCGMVEAARKAGWSVNGLLSPAVFEKGLKTGIMVEDISTGETRLLASYARQGEDDLVLGDWHFNRQILAWGNHILEISQPSDLLVVDELGPLEFNHQTGWQAALEILPRCEYKMALVVIRPDLLDKAHQLFDFSNIIEIDQTHTTDTWVQTFWPKIKKIKRDLRK